MDAKSNATFLFNFIKLKSLLNLQERLSNFKHNNEINATKLQKMKAEQMQKRFRLTDENGNKETLDLIKTLKDP